MKKVMEVGETDLNNLLNEHAGKAISLNFIRYIWEQMLEAVQVIHDENVVHTDLKPANFVLVKGRIKLIDFGISKAIGNDTTNISRDQQIGTANYMSPEALLDSGMGHNGKRLMKLGRAADVWSLGCILHQMVYGRTPFAHIRDIGQKIAAIQNPSYVISYASISCPLDDRGEERRELAVKIGPELMDSMKSCLRFEKDKRATIPQLLAHPFLRREDGTTTADGSPSSSPFGQFSFRSCCSDRGKAYGHCRRRHGDHQRKADEGRSTKDSRSRARRARRKQSVGCKRAKSGDRTVFRSLFLLLN